MDAWAREAHRRLADAGHRPGGARSAVIDVVADGGGCVSAGEVQERLRESGRPVAPASVYRALHALCALGLLRSVAVADSVVRFELIDATHHHAVCVRCGVVQPWRHDGVHASLSAVSGPAGWATEHIDLTLRGLCPRCAVAAG